MNDEFDTKYLQFIIHHSSVIVQNAQFFKRIFIVIVTLLLE